MKNLKRMLALLLTLAMVFGLVACSTNGTDTTDSGAATPSDSGGATSTDPATPVSNYDNPAPLVIATSELSGKFSSFYYETAYDGDIVDMGNLYLMSYDRRGEPIFHGISGDTRNYNGTDYTYYGPAELDAKYSVETGQTVYYAQLRKDLKFWDGNPVTARDILFYYYVALDPNYAGRASGLRSCNIVGAQNWQYQTSDAVFDKYAEKAVQIRTAGRNYTLNEDYTEEMHNDYWKWVDEQWEEIVRGIISYSNKTYASDADAAKLGFASYDEIKENEGLKVAYAMFEYGHGVLNEDTGLFGDKEGLMTWDLKTTFPTLEDFVTVTKAKYNNDPLTFFNKEKTKEQTLSIVDYVDDKFIKKFGPLDEEMAGQGVNSIEGIKMLDDYTVQVTVQGYNASAVYTILGIPLVPMHYYGDVSKWDPDNGKYGFDRGDLENSIKTKTDVPRGAGPYIFESWEDKVVTLKANPYYYKGQPKIPTVLFKETKSDEVATAMIVGEIDASEMNAKTERFDEVRSANSNGELVGDKIRTIMVDNNGYGYIGINANTVNVGGDPGSDASKALRKGFATIISVYRDVAVESYYGAAAAVIQYPISNSSWAAPQATDYGYKQAFSVDAKGNPIYRENMSPDEKYAAASAAALTWFEAAGCTIENGKVVKLPDGVRDSYEIIVPGQGSGNHPSYMVCQMAHDALAKLGFNLALNDPADSNVLWNTLNAGNAEFWCAAWSSAIDPDMYSVYHSANITGAGGSNNNRYSLADSHLDQLIMDARISDDNSFRKATYKQCLDIVVDWAVEIPVYQRKNCDILSVVRINQDTVTPDITTYWGWGREIEKLEMNDPQQ